MTVDLNPHELLKNINNDYIHTLNNTLRGKECVICLEKSDHIVVLQNCNHYFCKECLDEHSKKNDKCPICRADMVSYLDLSESKLVPIKIPESGAKIVSLDEYGTAFILANGQLFQSYLTTENPLQRVTKSLRILVVGFFIGMTAYAYFKEKRR